MANRYVHLGVYKTCPGCGQEFYAAPSHSRKKFCGRECWSNSVRGVSKSEEHKLALVASHASGMRKPTRHSFGSGGVREDLGHYVRSSWEANYARILQMEGTEYVYEPPGLKCDFLIPQDNLLIEIKPDHRASELSKFFACVDGTEYDGWVIGSFQYRELKKMYKGLVSWE